MVKHFPAFSAGFPLPNIAMIPILLLGTHDFLDMFSARSRYGKSTERRKNEITTVLKDHKKLIFNFF